MNKQEMLTAINMRVWASLAISILAATIGQILLKTGVNQVDLSGKGWINAQMVFTLLSRPLVWGGLFLYGVGAVFWLYILSKIDLSFAYPVAVGSSYLLVFVLSWIFINERTSPLRIVGALITLVGLYLISRT